MSGSTQSQTAVSAADVINSIGVNTHLDSYAYGYQNLTAVSDAINYLGIKNLRDSPQGQGDSSLWGQVAQATGAKFDAYIGETSPDGMSYDLSNMQQMAQQGLLNAMEGGNEEDDSGPQSMGNSLSYTASFQSQVYSAAHSAGLPAINMSFGAGWTAANNWHGNYDKVGDLSSVADYANAHTYPQNGAPDQTIQQLNDDAHLAASSRPVIATEYGLAYENTSDPTQLAKYALDGVMDGMKEGVARSYFYALYNDNSGNFGIMNPDGSPTSAGTALHNLTTLLQDGGSASGSLNYGLSGTQSGDNSLLINKSDGTYWLAVWNESGGSGHDVTLNLGSTASQIQVFDPLNGTNAVQTANNAGSITFSMPDHPELVEISSSGGNSGNSNSSSSSSSSTSGSATDAVNVGDSAQIGTTGTSTAGTTSSDSGSTSQDASSQGAAATSGTDTGSGNGNGTATPVTDTSSAAGTTPTDSSSTSQDASSQGAATTSGTDTGAASGDGTTTPVAANPDTTPTVAATPDTVAPAGQSTALSTPPATTGTINGSGDDSIISLLGNTLINTGDGSPVVFAGGSGNVVNAGAGNPTVMAFSGGNYIQAGSGSDVIRVAGSGNTVVGGTGASVIADSGSGNTIVLSAAGQGSEQVFGYTLETGDTYDLRSALAATTWNHDMSTIGNYLQVTPSGSDAVISIDPTGSGGAGVGSAQIAVLHGEGPIGLSTLLSHATVA